MKNCQRDGVFHVDGTYKITENGFPLVVFGLTIDFNPKYLSNRSKITKLDKITSSSLPISLGVPQGCRF